MENLDVKVLRTLCSWRSEGQPAVLATVVRTWGSSPRPVGSIMALSGQGRLVGSVSGGCVEDDLVHRFTRAGATAPERGIPAARPELVRYGVTADEAHRFGLPCGGTLELLLEFNPCAQGLRETVEALEQGRLICRTVWLASGQVSLAQTATPSELVITPEAVTTPSGRNSGCFSSGPAS